jgi:3-hydroxybutyryl-CoA dehydratase
MLRFFAVSLVIITPTISTNSASKVAGLGGGMIGFLASEMHFNYVAPVYIGDTITCTVTFTDKDVERRLFRAVATSVNQDGMEVLQPRFSGFPAKVRLAR